MIGRLDFELMDELQARIYVYFTSPAVKIVWIRYPRWKIVVYQVVQHVKIVFCRICRHVHCM